MQTGALRVASFIIVDAQSVKNTDTTESKGYDAGKKSRVSNALSQWIRWIYPTHAIEMITAAVTDRTGALKAIRVVPPTGPVERPS